MICFLAESAPAGDLFCFFAVSAPAAPAVHHKQVSPAAYDAIEAHLAWAGSESLPVLAAVRLGLETTGGEVCASAPSLAGKLSKICLSSAHCRCSASPSSYLQTRQGLGKSQYM